RESEARHGIDPEERAAAPEVPEGALGVARPRPVRLLAVAQLDAEPPVVGIEAPDLWQDAVQARELYGCHLVERLRRDERRRLQLARERDDVVERSEHFRGRRASELRVHAERLEDGPAQVVGERHLRSALDALGELLEPGVGVDAPLTRP